MSLTVLDIFGVGQVVSLKENKKSSLFRGFDQQRQLPLIVKKSHDTSSAACQSLFHEYQMLKRFAVPHIITVYGFQETQSGPCLLLEDCAAHAFSENSFPLSLDDFFKVAIKTTEALVAVHAARMIHGDINPSNIVVTPDYAVVKLIDFGNASLLPREEQALMAPERLAGTLLYIAPEQTGRMNRSIDYRADLYSLGVTFYEALTGVTPFMAQEALALLHAHLAQTPPPLQAYRPELPEALAALVLRLLAKNPEDRYQTAAGLLADLQYCAEHWKTQGAIPLFELGRVEARGQLHLSEKLYGRDLERQVLLDNYATMRKEGRPRSLFVTGASGAGKSVLLQELYRPLTEHHGYYLRGKYDQFERNVPYSALLQALNHWVEQVLTEPAEALTRWRNDLCGALGQEGQVLVDWLPALAHIIGPQAQVPGLSATEAEQRLHRVLQIFFNVVARHDHPLSLFLDDLQWADEASLTLLALLLNKPEGRYLLFLGAYRDNEVPDYHPLQETLRRLRAQQVPVQMLQLNDLTSEQVGAWLLDSFPDVSEHAQLTQLLCEKTSGNPFFLKQFVTNLYEKKLLSYQGQVPSWQWNVDDIRAENFTENVVDFVLATLSRLPEDIQKTLQLAAALGNTFTYKDLVQLSEVAVGKLHQQLHELLGRGLLLGLGTAYAYFRSPECLDSISVPLNLEFRFCHDRIQQAAYALERVSRVQLHAHIARAFWNERKAGHASSIFALVYHANEARSEWRKLEERHELLLLNLEALRAAKDTAAYESALFYAHTALGLLPQNAWETDYALTHALYGDACAVACLQGDFTQLQIWTDLALKRTKTVLDEVPFYRVLLDFYIAAGQLAEALQLTGEILRKLGVAWPRHVRFGHVLRQLAKTQWVCLGKKPAQLLDLPRMEDPKQRAVMELMAAAIPVSYLTHPNVMALLVLSMVERTVRHGTAEQSPLTYVMYGIVLAGGLGRIKKGYAYGQLALELADKLQIPQAISEARFPFNGMIRPYYESLGESVNDLWKTYRFSLEHGLFEYVSYAVLTICSQNLTRGYPLAEWWPEAAHYKSLLLQLKQETGIAQLSIEQQVVENLLGQNKVLDELNGSMMDEASMIEKQLRTQHRAVLYLLYTRKQWLKYLFRDYAGALVASRQAAEYVQTVPGWHSLPHYYFYHALTLLGLLRTETTSWWQRLRSKRGIKSCLRKVKRSARSAPTNYGALAALLEAEWAQLRGQKEQAMRAYDRAIQRALIEKNFADAALANELAGECYLRWQHNFLGMQYLNTAYQLYQRWGAQAKLAQLKQLYPALQVKAIDVAESVIIKNSIETYTSSTEASSEQLDLHSVLKASQSISGEIRLQQLLERLLTLAMENAGAKRGALLLHEDKRLRLMLLQDGLDARHELELADISINEHLAASTVYYALNSKSPLILDQAQRNETFAQDDYIRKHALASILCLPLLRQGEVLAVLYLENQQSQGVFTPQRLAILQVLAAQAAISLENAQLYAKLEAKVEARTQELQSTQQQLFQSQKLESLGQLASGISHEFNNLLGGVLGFSTLLKRRYKDDAKGLSYLEKIELATRTAADLTKKMLGFARKGKYEKAVLQLNQLVNDAMNLLKSSLTAMISIKLELSAELALVEGDTQQLLQVLVNLSNNARDAMPQGGSLYLRTANIKLTADNALGLPLGAYVQLEVEDDGIGIPIEHQDKIFDPFFSRKPVGQGAGLGLAMVYGIVKNHGGMIRVHSTPGAGACFTVYLPVYQGAKQASAASVAA